MRREWMRCLSLLAALMLLFSSAAFAADDLITPARYDTVTVTEGVVEVDYKVYMRKGPGKNYDRVASLRHGDVVTVLGEDSGWYHVEFEGKEGYVHKDLLTVRTYEDQVPHIDEADFEVTLEEAQYPVILQRKESFSLRGVVTSSMALTAVKVSIIDQITMKEEIGASKTFTQAQNVTSFDLIKLDNSLPFRKLTAGEKRLLVTAESGSVSRAVLDVIFHVAGAVTAEPVSVTGKCQITVAHDKAANVTDGKLGTTWAPTSDEDTLALTLPDSDKAYTMTLSFGEPIGNLRLDCYDEGGELIDSLEEAYGAPRYATSHVLPAGTARVVFSTNNLDSTLAELRVYESESISSLVQLWQGQNENTDVMVIVTNPGDELLYFGGLIPYCTGQGKSLTAVYMTGDSRDAMEQSMSALWACGAQNAPVFLGLPQKDVKKYEDAVSLWDLEATVERLVTLIRAEKPDLIVTHNVEGENDNHQRTYTATIVRRAVLLAADPESYPESFAAYGAWDVKKLYFHQYAANTINLDYSQKLDRFGLSAQQVAELAFGSYTSLSKLNMSKYNQQYEAAAFGLIYTTVGDDEEKSGLFEHIN